MAQKWRMARYGVQNKRPALDEAALRELALAYVSRFATSGARLVRYLDRKIRERGWAGEAEADPEALATRFAELGYLDDASYARMKGASMQRRGLGAARIRGRWRLMALRRGTANLRWTRRGKGDGRLRTCWRGADASAPMPPRRPIPPGARSSWRFSCARVMIWEPRAPGCIPTPAIFPNGATE